MVAALSSRAPLALLALALLSLGAEGCRRPAGSQIVLTKDQEQQISENVLTAPPAGLQNKVDCKFEDKLTLLGYDIKGQPKKGGTFDLVMYYRVDQPVQGDWKIFVHFEAPGKRRQPFDHYGVGGLYPVGQWKKGEIIRDVVQVQVPADWSENSAQVLIGFFDWGLYTTSQGDRRLKVASPGTTTVQGDGRVLLTTVQLGSEGGEQPKAGGAGNEPTPKIDMQVAAAMANMVKQYSVGKVATAPVIDGKDDEWQQVPAIAVAIQPSGQPLANNLRGQARLQWNAENLFFTARFRDEDVRNSHTANDSELWEGDNVELFLRLPGQDGKYYELQFSPNGAHFDAMFTAPRTPKWEEASKFDSGMEMKTTTEGTVNADGADVGFVVEAKIPWKNLGLTAAPPVGTVIESNVYRIDDKGAHDMGHMGTWAAVGGDFHKLDGAGKLTISDRATAPAAPSAPVPAAAPIK